MGRLRGVDRTVAVDEASLYRGSPTQRIKELVSVWRRVGLRRFDRVFLVHGDARYRALVMPLLTSPVRTLRREMTDRMLPIPGRCRGDEYVRLLDQDENAGPIIGRWPLGQLDLPAGERRSLGPSTILVPGGAKNILREDALRRWPAERYAELARLLVANGHQVEIVGGADDAWVRPFFAGIPVVDHVGGLSLVDTATTMAAADVVVSHDTGPMHLARLVRTPLVALFGPTDPYSVIGTDSRTIALRGLRELACRPCYTGRELANCRDNICMSDITAEQVLSAVQTLTNRRSRAEAVSG